jgi:hypothetical protein
MAEPHPVATPHIHGFITSPGQTDILMVVALVLMVTAVLLVGILFFWLHSLPERRAHKYDKVQFELIAVLGLLSLFTHMHVFWVVALLLAFVKVPDVKLPDIESPLARIAHALEMRGQAPDVSAQKRGKIEIASNVELGG